MLLPEYAPCIDLCRDKGFVDQRFFAIVSLFKDGKETLLFGRHNNYPFLLRSLLKPLQASIMADYDTANYFNFSPSELAIMQASHAGEKIHTDTVTSILNKAGLNETDLKCPKIPPLNSSAKDAPPFLGHISPLHNNCSGKHSMFLSVSKQLNFPLETYTKLNHPVQKLALKKIIELSEFKNPPQSFDGCTLPVWALPFQNIFLSFQKLYEDKKYTPLKNAYMKNPYIIGGKDDTGYRQDTFFMLQNSDSISKTGAGGFLSVYNNITNEFLLIKMAQDNNHARFLLASFILNKLNWIKTEPDYNFYNELNEPVGKFNVHNF